MITELSQLFHRVGVSSKPEDLLLQKGSWVRFTPEWPDTYKWVRGNTFIVSEEPILVPYPVDYILPESDYQDIDLSNATGGLRLYPESEGILYETTVGLKEGNYLLHTYVPVNKYVYYLAYPTMYPDVTDAALRYLGAKTYNDSPYESPLWKLYFIKNMPAFILRLYVLSGEDFVKVMLSFNINKCQLTKIENPTVEQQEKALLIRYYTQFAGF